MKKPTFNELKIVFCYFAFAKAILTLSSCKTKTYDINKISAGQTTIDSTLQTTEEIDLFIEPYKKSVDQQMSEKLCYNPSSMHKNDHKYNTPIGNMMAQIVREQAAPIFKSRTGKTIDVVLLNHGGIRAGLPKGDVTMRNAYEIMPFENSMVVAELSKEKMDELVQYLIDKKRAHPFDGFKITLPKNEQGKATVELEEKDSYYVITNDYLYNGGDNMVFFKDAPITKLNYKIRNAMIDYFKKIDTLEFKRDDRFDIEK